MNNVAETWTWSNFTWSNSSITGGTTIAWRIYYNDTSGNVNKTDIMTFTVKTTDGSSCTLASQCSGGYCVHNICRSTSIYCGDGYCDTGEDCSSCSEDCGICPTPACLHIIRIIDVKDIDARPGENVTAEITVQNTGCYDEEDIRVYIECPDDWECGSITIPELKRGETAIVSLEIEVSREIAFKIYHFDVIVENAFYKNLNELDIIIGELCGEDSDCEVGEICLYSICQRLFDIKIVRADSPIEPGEFLDFTYKIKSISNISGDVKISYWLEDKNGIKVSEGSEIIFIGAKDEKLIESNLFIPSGILGIHTLFTELDIQNLTTIASKTIEVAKEVPLILDMQLSELPEIYSLQIFEFSVNLAFNKDEIIPLVLEEKITRDNTIVWQAKGEIVVNRSMTIEEKVSDLKSGSYILEVKANYDNKTSSLLKSFNVKSSIIDYRYVILTVVIIAIIFCIVIVYKVFFITS